MNKVIHEMQDASKVLVCCHNCKHLDSEVDAYGGLNRCVRYPTHISISSPHEHGCSEFSISESAADRISEDKLCRRYPDVLAQLERRDQDCAAVAKLMKPKDVVLLFDLAEKAKSTLGESSVISTYLLARMSYEDIGKYQHDIDSYNNRRHLRMVFGLSSIPAPKMPKMPELQSVPCDKPKRRRKWFSF